MLVIGVATYPRADSHGESNEEAEDVAYVFDEVNKPKIMAKAYVVFDAQTGEIIFSEHADDSLPIASVTKLFTAASLLDTDLLDREVEVTEEDVATEGRAGKLVAGQKIKLRELLFPLLLESSNDAAEAIKKYLPEKEWLNIKLSDASGLSDANVATAKALAEETAKLYQEKKYLFDITKLPQYVGEDTGWVNNSPVKDLEGYLGGKHGYTVAANRTLVAFFSEASLGNRELGYVILGSDDVREDIVKLRAVVADSVQLK